MSRSGVYKVYQVSWAGEEYKVDESELISWLLGRISSGEKEMGTEMEEENQDKKGGGGGRISSCRELDTALVQVPHDECWLEPVDRCELVPKQKCWEEPRQPTLPNVLLAHIQSVLPPSVQRDQLYMAVCFWSLVKKVTYLVHACTEAHTG